MKIAKVYVQGNFAGLFAEVEEDNFIFTYTHEYNGAPVSLTMPTTKRKYTFDTFPPFFEGLLPEGNQLESLLRREKIDKKDYFSQLLVVGSDLVGDVTLERYQEVDQ
jgi:serine/threonine-protein kinase HipA